MNTFLTRIVQRIGIDKDLQAFVKKGISGTIVLEFLARVFVFLTTIILTNWLSIEDYGQYSFYMASVISIATIGTLGLDDYVVRAIRSASKLESSVIPIFITFTISLVVAVCWFGLDNDLQKNSLIYLILGGSLLTMQYMLSSILKGHKHILSAQIPEQLVRPLIFLFFISFYWILSKPILFDNLVQFIFISILASSLIAFILLIRKESFTKIFRHPGLSFKWSPDLIFFAALTFFGILRHKLDILILGYYDLLSATAIYNVASKLSDFILVGLILTNAVYMPLFAEQKAERSLDKLKKVLESSLIINMLIGTTIFLILLVLGPWILSWFGEQYTDGFTSLIVLSTSTWIYVLIGPYIIMLMMIGYERQVLLGLILGVLVQILLCIWLLPIDPILGMAIAKGVAIVSIQLFMLSVAWIKLGLKPVFLQWFEK